MVIQLGAGASPRKLRLLGVACCARLSDFMPDYRSKRAIETAERFADSQTTPEELSEAQEYARQTEQRRVWPNVNSQSAAHAATAVAAPPGGFDIFSVIGWCATAAQQRTERGSQAGLLRDIFGNPFRPVVFAPEWRTSTAVALADAMYAARDFAHLPVLADALEEAGCDNPDVLAHCRGPGPHVRGCWVVDLVLGKT
jgi:hypothetical protein